MSMLKTTVLSQVFVANKVLATNKLGDIKGDDKSIEICRKLSKTRKLFKSQKSAKSEKKLSKSGNLSNFDAKENGLSFLTPDAKMAFNYLWLAFTKTPIFQHFHLEYHI